MKIAVDDDVAFVTTKKNVCIDIDCSVTLKNRKFMTQQLNENMKVQQLTSSLSIRKVSGKLIKINDFVMIHLFVTDINDVDEITTTVVFVEVHLINDFKINMLVDVNVLKSQRMIVNFDHNILVIESCEIKIVIDSVSRVKSHFKRIIRNQKIFTILFDELTKVSIIFHDDLSFDRDFFFESQCSKYLNQNDDVFAHIVDANLFFVQVHNIIDFSIILSRRVKLKSVIKYNQQECYQITVNEVSKTACD